MDDPEERLRLEHDIWVKDYADSMHALREANAELVTILDSCILNQSKVTELLIVNKKRLVDGVLLNLCRAQSQKKMPLITAALSVLNEANHIPREFHDVMTTYFKGSLASETWTSDFLRSARDRRPPPSDDPLQGVAVVTFDNLSMQVDYSSYVREGEGGHRLDMTNWLLTRPSISPRWQPYKIYHEPMFSRLQSSYSDVEYELTEMTRAYRSLPILFVAGDGLSLIYRSSLPP